MHLDKFMQYKVIGNSQTPKKIPALTEEIPEPQGLLALRARNTWPVFASVWLDFIPFRSQNSEALSIISTWECSLAWVSPWQRLSVIWKGWSGPKLTAKSQVMSVILGSIGAGIPVLSTSLVWPRTPWLLLVGFVEDSWEKQLGKAWKLKFTTENLQFFWTTNNCLPAGWDSNHNLGSARGCPWEPWATFPWPLCHREPGKCPHLSLLFLKPPVYRDITCYCNWFWRGCIGWVHQGE